jgi:hypothetical protein
MVLKNVSKIVLYLINQTIHLKNFQEKRVLAMVQRMVLKTRFLRLELSRILRSMFITRSSSEFNLRTEKAQGRRSAFYLNLDDFLFSGQI